MSRMRPLCHRPRQVPTSTEPALGLQISETEKQATGRHAQEKDGTMSSLESLCEDIRTNVTVWKRYRDKGGSDPSWSDGDNMNLCRNHIIDDRRRIEEIIARDGIEPPADLFSRLDNEFHFTLDAASSESNHKCSKYYTAGNSAFNHEWGGRRYSAIRHMARQSRNGCASAAWKPAAKTPSSSCFCRLARIPAGSNSSFSTVRRSGSSKGDCGSKRTAYRAGRHHFQA